MNHRIEEVVAGGMCVGCGACQVATSGAIPVTIGRFGAPVASLLGVSEDDKRRGSKVCPFSDEAKNEDELGAPHPAPAAKHDARVGDYTGVYAGRRSSAESLLGSSSGGLTSWVAGRLLEEGRVDAIIHVAPSSESDGLFSYEVTRSLDGVEENRKSMYYAASFGEAILSMRGDGKTYAFIGVPCFVRAARLLCEEDETLRAQIKYFLGLVCGHLKSRFFAESLAWQVGVSPEELESVDFRVKVEGTDAGNYDFSAHRKGEANPVSAPTRSLLGGNWGHGMFQLNACNYCDDIFAETADVVFGDAWLPAYLEEWRGTNIVLSRNTEIDELLQDGVLAGTVNLDSISVDDAALSQAGNFRHRRDGLAVRLADDISAGIVVPVKRVEPTLANATAKRIRLIRQRRRMSNLSSELFVEAKAADSLNIFMKGMRSEVRAYQRVEGKRFFRRAFGVMKRAVIKFVRA